MATIFPVSYRAIDPSQIQSHATQHTNTPHHTTQHNTTQHDTTQHHTTNLVPALDDSTVGTLANLAELLVLLHGGAAKQKGQPRRQASNTTC